MYKKLIKYVDFNDNENQDLCFFNLSKTELLKLETEYVGGLANYLTSVVNVLNSKESTEEEKSSAQIKMVEFLKTLVLHSYGIVSEDGKSFVKKNKDGSLLADTFENTAAFDALFMELLTDTSGESAQKFINGVMPSDLVAKANASLEK